MRTVLTLSVTDEQKKIIKKRAKKAGLTVSAFVIQSIGIDDDVITEKELLEMVAQGQKEYREGKTVTIKNGADLLKQIADENSSNQTK
ncbi:hypothetical protein GF340_03510 [Candidatus Peregrinibacteria bacterium]|nr:hypothetical protein [Candidatus Peregrinibacteria bacterium]